VHSLLRNPRCAAWKLRGGELRPGRRRRRLSRQRHGQRRRPIPAQRGCGHLRLHGFSRGGYVVNNFETGEWLAYTVNVATSGNYYDIELRAATNWDFPNSAYHVEIDGVNVTGSVVLPDTGGWSSFQWAGKKTVSLSAGTHVLKLVSDQQYFNLNQIRILA